MAAIRQFSERKVELHTHDGEEWHKYDDYTNEHAAYKAGLAAMAAGFARVQVRIMITYEKLPDVPAVA